MRRYIPVLILAALAVPIAVMSAQLSGLDGGYWSRTVSVTTTTGCVVDVTDAGSTCALFPAGLAKGQWYNAVVVKGNGTISDTVSGCFTQTGTSATVQDGIISADSLRGAGGGDCFTIASAADRHDQRPWGTDIRTRPGGRLGLCAGSVYSAGDVLYPPCSVRLATETRANAAECTAYGLSGSSATCQGESLWTQDQRDYQGVVLLLDAASGTQSVHVRKVRIQER